MYRFFTYTTRSRSAAYFMFLTCLASSFVAAERAEPASLISPPLAVQVNIAVRGQAEQVSEAGAKTRMDVAQHQTDQISAAGGKIQTEQDSNTCAGEGKDRASMEFEKIAAELWMKTLEQYPGKKRVDRTMFMTALSKAPNNLSFNRFLTAIFDFVATRKPGPPKTDLCPLAFALGVIIASEWYPAQGDPADKLGFVSSANLEGCETEAWKKNRQILDDDFQTAKQGKDRVSENDFVEFYMGVFKGDIEKLPRPEEEQEGFMAYLSKAFEAGLLMMLDRFPDKLAARTLGGHCFRYAGFVVRHYCFDGKCPKLGIQLPIPK